MRKNFCQGRSRPCGALHPVSSVFKALADPTRRQVLQLLRRGPMSEGSMVQ
jgi:hypothetical protein